MTRRELIVYAVPEGELADACERFFAAAREIGPTSAHAYPPHCTLTGFFRRRSVRVGGVVAEVRTLVAGRSISVEVLDLSITDRWVGLVLGSPDLLALTDAFVRAHQLDEGDDALRPKDWLHLSLAYGADDLTAHAALARQCVDPTAAATWRVGLWERSSDGTWTELTRPTTSPFW